MTPTADDDGGGTRAATNDDGGGARAADDAEPSRASPTETPAERTRFAWRRTTLAASIIGLLSLRLATHTGSATIGMTMLALIAIGWLVLLRLAHRRILAVTRRPPPAIAGTPRVVALIVVGFAVASVVMVIW